MFVRRLDAIKYVQWYKPGRLKFLQMNEADCTKERPGNNYPSGYKEIFCLVHVANLACVGEAVAGAAGCVQFMWFGKAAAI